MSSAAKLRMDKQQSSNYPTLGKLELSYQGVYACPVCRHGQISQLVMVDAFACNFCRHIFTANLKEQSLRLEDSNQPFRWRWTGSNWQPLRWSASDRSSSTDQEVTLAVWLIAIALLILPPSLIWLSYHTFPPLPDSPWDWFPLVWTIASLLIHFLLVLWLLVEHYQLPAYVSLRLRLQQWQR
jgi:hypothetical protein